MNTQTIILDVTKPSGIPQTVAIGQGDANGTTLVAKIYDNGEALTLTGYSVKLCIQTPNGAGYYECDGTVSGNAATFAIDETYAGTVFGVSKIAYVEVIDGDTTICSTNRFTVVVLQNGTEGADPNGAYTNGVQQFLEDAQEQLDDAIEGALSTKADADGAYPDLYAGAAGEIAGYSEGTSIAYTGSKFQGMTVYGESSQNGTPTPSAPIPIQVVETVNFLNTSLAHLQAINTAGTWTGSKYTYRGVDITVNDDGTLTISGTATGSFTFYLESTNLGLPAGSYYLAACPSGGSQSTYYTRVTTINSSETVISRNNDNGSGVAFTVTNEEVRQTCHIHLTSGDSFTTPVTISPMLNVGSTAAPFMPYGYIGINCGGVPTPIDLGGNVLASLPDGTRDELNIDSTGAVTLTKRTFMLEFDGSDMSGWSITTSGNHTFGVYLNNHVTSDGAVALTANNSMCSSGVFTSIGTGTTNLGYSNTTRYLRFRPVDEPTIETLTTYLENNPTRFVLPLKEPQTITLDPIEPPDTSASGTISVTAAVTPTIRVSLGEFDMSADELRDRALSVIAAIENGKASTNYAVGSYLIHKGTLYKVTSAIASGEEIDPGTNVTATTVMAELIALTA